MTTGSRAERREAQDRQRLVKEAGRAGLELKWREALGEGQGDSAEALDGEFTEVLLVRHGETEWNKAHRLQGHRDVPLSELGLLQAHAAGEHIAANERCIAAVYTSDLLRARHTADAIAAPLGLQAVCLAGLRERHLGELEGKTVSEAKLQCPLAWQVLQAGSFSERIPGGGESSIDVMQRASRALEQLVERHAGQRVVVTSHGGTISNLHLLATGRYPPGHVANCAVHVLRVRRAGSPWGVGAWGDRRHLTTLGAESASSFGGGAKSG